MALLFSCGQAPKDPSVPSKETISSGRVLFKENCSACHSPEKWIIGPPFQRIREANGLDWSISWVKSSQRLIKKRDTNALYIFYSWKKMMQPDFPNLSKKEIENIFDFVDSYPFDSTNYEHRKESKLERWNYVDSLDRAWKNRQDLMNDTLSYKGSATRKRERQVKK
jgi:cytochrome c551/c552